MMMMMARRCLKKTTTTLPVLTAPYLRGVAGVVVKKMQRTNNINSNNTCRFFARRTTTWLCYLCLPAAAVVVLQHQQPNTCSLLVQAFSTTTLTRTSHYYPPYPTATTRQQQWPSLLSPTTTTTTAGAFHNNKQHNHPKRMMRVHVVRLFSTTDENKAEADAADAPSFSKNKSNNSTRSSSSSTSFASSSSSSSFSPVNGDATTSEENETSYNDDKAADESSTASTTATAPSSSSRLDSSILAIDPNDIQIVTLRPPSPKLNRTAVLQKADSSSTTTQLQHLPFVHMFRGSANYIANHRNTLAVYHIPGGLTDLPDPVVFRDLMNDIALTWLLGMKIVLVVGCRYQIEKRLQQEHHEQDAPRVAGLRVTDRETLRMVKEEAGFVRFEVERQLARSLRKQGGSSGTERFTGGSSSNSGDVYGSSGGNRGNNNFYDGNVVSGNFYSAQPLGILDGVDYQYTGFVRRVEVEKIRRLHESRDICLMTTLGVSPSGQVFNVNSESLAAAVAGALQASKVIYFTEREMELRHKVHGNKIQHLRVSDARNLLDHVGLKIDRKGYSTLEPRSGSVRGGGGEVVNEMDPAAIDMLHKIGWSVQAIQQGVKRAHIISPKHGALLQELYTRDGSGTMVSGDLYDGIRQANVGDVNGIHELIEPLIKMGTLIDRPKDKMEREIDTYYVYTRDNLIVACGQLKQFEDGFAEIGCLVVSKEYRSRGRGDAMLCYLERMCVMNGCTSIFVLSTQTMEWFVERGFKEVGVEQLPPSRQATYNYDRRSKIYMKKIESMRDLDASELWWNR